MDVYLCIASEWYSQSGGLSSFNRQLCLSLAKIQKVYCYLPDFTDDEFNHAKRHSVKLIKPKRIYGIPVEQSMMNKPVLEGTDIPGYLLGHDRFLGPTMLFLQINYFPAAKTAFFIHTNPGEIELYKPEQKDVDHAFKSEEREKIQKETAKNSSLIVAVGPKLFYDVQSYMSGIDGLPPIVRYDPGLLQPPSSINYESKSQIPQAFIMGRLDDYHLKGVDIAYRSMNRLFKQ